MRRVDPRRQAVAASRLSPRAEKPAEEGGEEATSFFISFLFLDCLAGFASEFTTITLLLNIAASFPESSSLPDTASVIGNGLKDARKDDRDSSGGDDDVPEYVRFGFAEVVEEWPALQQDSALPEDFLPNLKLTFYSVKFHN